MVDFPPQLGRKVAEIASQIGTLWNEGKFQEAEKLFENQYKLIRSYEEKLPEAQRYHKGSPLHNWGISILLQNDSRRIKEGYTKIFLAYIEDLLDFDDIEQVRAFPAYRTLIGVLCSLRRMLFSVKIRRIAPN